MLKLKQKVVHWTLYVSTSAHFVSGLRHCSCCRKNLPELQFRAPHDVLYATCNACRERIRQRRTTIEEVQDEEDTVDQMDPADGVHQVEPDEFDNIFGTGDDVPEFALPNESAIPEAHRAYINNFLEAERALKREICNHCEEIDWDMRLKDGQCHRCKKDKHEVKRFSRANGVSPSKSAITLILCSPFFQVKFLLR